MANNYTISGNTTLINSSTGESTSVFQQAELIGDIVIAGNIANWTPEGINSSAVLTITPNSGYVISASNFSVTNISDFADSIASVTFTDTSTAGTTANTVTVKVNLLPTFKLLGTANDTISLDIDGSTAAAPWSPPNMAVAVEIISEDDPGEADPGRDTNLDSNATVVITANTGFSRDAAVVGNVTTYEIAGEATPNISKNIATLTVTADSGYELQSQPYLMYVGMPSNILRLSTRSITRDSSDRITAYGFNMMYKNNAVTKANSGAKAFIKYETTKIPTATTEIKNVIHGSSQVASVGETRPIKIHGDSGAEFDLTITKDSDGSSIVDTKVANADIFNPIGGIVRGINKKLVSHGRRSGITSYTLDQEFPSTIVLTTLVNGAMSSTATMSVDDDTNVKVGDRVLAKGIPNNTVIKVSVVNPGSVANRFTLDTAATIADNAVVSFIRSEAYHINIYAKTGTTLKSNIPTVVPHYTLNQYINPVLTLTATVGAGYTLTTYAVIAYQGRAGKYPNQLKHISSIPDRFSISYRGTSAGGGKEFTITSGGPSWSSTLQTNSNWTNSVYADNNGTHLEISNLKATLVSTTIADITADVFIKKWGTADVTMNLATGDFLTCEA